MVAGSSDPRCKAVGTLGNSVYCTIGKVEPEQLVTIVIVFKLSEGLPNVGVLGFEYTAFDQPTQAKSAVCGQTPVGGINLGIPKDFKPLPFPAGFDQTVSFGWKAALEAPTLPGAKTWINTTVSVMASSKLAAVDTQVTKSLFWGAVVSQWTTTAPNGKTACTQLMTPSGKPTAPPMFECRLGEWAPSAASADSTVDPYIA
jgi:hypothetical protein